MRVFEIVLLIGLILCAIACNFTKKLLPAVVAFMSYSTIMSIIWMILQSPDLAITEAAVGAGITSILWNWLNTPERRSAKEVANLIYALMRHGLKGALTFTDGAKER